MYLWISSLLLLASYAAASPSANHFVDSIVNGPLQNELRNTGLSPSRLSDFSTEFEDKVIIIGKVHGKANYTEGYLYGANDTRRYSECQGPSYSFGNGYINCSLALNSLTTQYKGKVKYGKLPNFDVKATANITRTVLHVEFIQRYNQRPQVNNYRFQELGQIHPKFTGLGSPLNKFLKVLEDGYKSHVSAVLFDSVSKNYVNALSRAAGYVPMPLN